MPPTFDISRSPIISLANCPVPTDTAHNRFSIAGAPQGRGRGRRSVAPVMLPLLECSRQHISLFFCGFVQKIQKSEFAHVDRSLRTSYNSPLLSRRLSRLFAQATTAAAGVVVNPSPITDIIMFHPDPPQYISEGT